MLFLSVESTGICREISRSGGLFPLPVAHVTIHVEAAEGPLERIDHAVIILVEFLKMIVLELTCLRV